MNGLEQLERHFLRQSALVGVFSSGPTTITETAPSSPRGLPSKFLAEAALLPLERVGQRLQRAVVGAAQKRGRGGRLSNSASTAFLQHALFIADDHVRRVQLDQPFSIGYCG